MRISRNEGRMNDGGGINIWTSCSRGVRALLLWKYNRDNIWGREGLFWSTRLLIIPVISSAVIRANAYCQPKVSVSVNKQLEWHQLQCGACTTPPLYQPVQFIYAFGLPTFPSPFSLLPSHPAGLSFLFPAWPPVLSLHCFVKYSSNL